MGDPCIPDIDKSKTYAHIYILKILYFTILYIIHNNRNTISGVNNIHNNPCQITISQENNLMASIYICTSFETFGLYDLKYKQSVHHM